MAYFTNSFVAGKMDKDLDNRLMPDGVYRDANNMIVDISESASVGSGQNPMGTTKVADLATVSGRSVTGARTIGATKYERDNLIYWLVAGDFFDGIYEYNELTGATVRVLQSNKVNANTPSKLNFDKQYIVTGINYVNGFLYWTDNLNPPRKINIARAKGYNIDDSRILDDISVILAPPLNSPKIKLIDADEDVNQANNMSEKFLTFSYRYKYIDGQYSAMSPFSAVAFFPKQYSIDYDSGNNKAMLNSSKSAIISFETGGKNVTEIQLLMHDTRNLNTSIVESFNKAKLNYGDFAVKTFEFSNNKTYTVLTSDQITRLFDNVPLLARAQEFVGNRLMYGNYTQFYDITDCSGKDISVGLKMELLSEDVSGQEPSQTFRSDRDYETGIVYLDSYGRSTTVLTSEKNTLYIPAANSITANSLVVSVKSPPPCWATGWRLVIKQSKKSYCNIFPILFYPDGLFRYFLVNESDRDKFAVGEYVIFKSTAAGATLSNKKYKILEFDNKPAGFLTGGLTEVAGLYFKIKVDSIDEISSANVFVNSSTGIGGGLVDRSLVNKTPADIMSSHGYPVVELPIFYGEGNESALSAATYPTVPFQKDARFTISIDGNGTFSYYCSGGYSGTALENTPVLIQSGIPILVGAQTPIYSHPTLVGIGFYIVWNSNLNLVIGDKWKINVRSQERLSSSAAIIPDANWSPTNNPETDRSIQKGAVITIYVQDDHYNPYLNLAVPQTFSPSPAVYANIEEWWYESGACNAFINYDINGVNVGAKYVRFRRGKDFMLVGGVDTDFDSNTIETGNIINAETLNYPVRMLIYSSVPPNTNSNNLFGQTDYNQARLTVQFSIQQQEVATICETDAKNNDLDIYHELSGTYRIENGLHKTLWEYQDFTAPAGGLTNLGQVNPNGVPTANDVIHYFSVGDEVYVTSANNAYVPSGFYTVTAVPNNYNIIIDLPFPGSGPTIGGGVAYSDVDQDQANYSTVPAIVKLNNPNTRNSDFNAWAFGNGLESDRIYDDFAAATLQYSPRSNSAVEEYKQRISDNAICYSGIYGMNTNVNRLNEFNLSLANFKYLHKEFGAIHKLHARDSDLLVFQYDKISSVLYEKNLLSDSIGGGSIASVPEVLGTQIPLQYENGISGNPESFAFIGSSVFCTDARRGTVIQIEGRNLKEVNLGMTDYFRDIMRDNPNDQKLGAYDPFLDKYTLAFNDNTALPCKLFMSPRVKTVASNTASILNFLFTITTESAWTIAVANDGFGTNWVSNYATSGTGTQDISAVISPNNTQVTRTIRFIVTYCSGLTQTFTLTQGSSPIGTITVMTKQR